jgi:Uma2 family endonuclease
LQLVGGPVAYQVFLPLIKPQNAMETSVFDELETYFTEDKMSLNHSRTIQRIAVQLEQYDDEYDILPELEMKLNGKIVKPDVCVYPNLPEDWYNDILFMTDPPVIAIEVVSPRQAVSDITDKMNTVYFPAGVQSVWIVIPTLQLITVRTPDGQKLTFDKGIIRDPATGLEIVFEKIFR